MASNNCFDRATAAVFTLAPLQAVLLLWLCAASVSAHGLMVNPRSRNWKAYLEENFSWAHGLSMGGEGGPAAQRRLHPTAQPRDAVSRAGLYPGTADTLGLHGSRPLSRGGELIALGKRRLLRAEPPTP